MPTPLELLRIADLVKLAADTAQACSEMKANGQMDRVIEVSLRIKAAAEELAEIGKKMERDRQERDD